MSSAMKFLNLFEIVELFSDTWNIFIEGFFNRSILSYQFIFIAVLYFITMPWYHFSIDNRPPPNEPSTVDIYL